jgi:hypothetical protein
MLFTEVGDETLVSVLIYFEILACFQTSVSIPIHFDHGFHFDLASICFVLGYVLFPALICSQF